MKKICKKLAQLKLLPYLCRVKLKQEQLLTLKIKRKMRTKTFTIENNEHNLNWVEDNLDTRDYEVKGNDIIITYFEDFQKK
nr:MAG TPA: hypothetical protein [Caudoviricetes sp.]